MKNQLVIVKKIKRNLFCKQTEISVHYEDSVASGKNSGTMHPYSLNKIDMVKLVTYLTENSQFSLIKAKYSMNNQFQNIKTENVNNIESLATNSLQRVDRKYDSVKNIHNVLFNVNNGNIIELSHKGTVKAENEEDLELLRKTIEEYLQQ